MPFHVDSKSGEIFLRSNIDYERATSYRLVVTARDQDHDK